MKKRGTVTKKKTAKKKVVRKKRTVVDELRSIEEKYGTLLPENVVEFAKNPRTLLHRKFNWDDTAAAHNWRLHQARMILRTVVTVMPNGNNVPTRVFVSLKPDRMKGSGYRNIVSVMNDDEMRSQIISDALDDMRTFRKKYNRLVELQKLFLEIADAEIMLEDMLQAAAA